MSQQKPPKEKKPRQKTREQLLEDINDLFYGKNALVEQVHALDKKDYVVRENLSKFLGSIKRRDHYSHQEEILVLEWSGIYFELGKLIMKQTNQNDVNSIKKEMEVVLENQNVIFKKLNGNKEEPIDDFMDYRKTTPRF